MKLSISAVPPRFSRRGRGSDVERVNITQATGLLRDAARSPIAATRGENMLIHGDNLPVLTHMYREGRRFRCIYLDPPFNTGRTFAEYTDTRAPHEWAEMMRPRIELLRELLTDDGVIWVEIDDTELGSLVVLMDEVFGRDARLSIITVARSAATGHKAINRGPVNVADYLVLYARDRKRARLHPVTRERDGMDPAYRTVLLNPNDAPERWTFEPLGAHVAKLWGFRSAASARRELGEAVYNARMDAWALENAARVVRFAQPRYEAISIEARHLVDLSRAQPTRIFVLTRPRHKPMILRGGNRVLFLKDKVDIRDGRPRLVEPLTNIWNDIGFQGIAKEGGVTFARNKKPERLLARILAMSTDPGDWVLDPFVGSGTTTAVAHKLGRRWVGIENGDHFNRLCLRRMQSVVSGEGSGVSRMADFRGGGGFGVYTWAGARDGTD